MRNLFLALLLANLAFAAWHAWFATPPGAVRVADPDLPSLTLVSELPEGLRTAGTEPARACGTVMASPRCCTSGSANT